VNKINDKILHISEALEIIIGLAQLLNAFIWTVVCFSIAIRLHSVGRS
jgi:hypothetical protein